MRDILTYPLRTIAFVLHSHPQPCHKGTLPANKLNKAQTSPHFAIRNVQQGNAISFFWVRTPPPRFRISNFIGCWPQELFQKFNVVWKPRREQDPILLSKIHHTYSITHFARPSRHDLPTWPNQAWLGHAKKIHCSGQGQSCWLV